MVADELKGTKLRIFETAADLFSKEGYHAVSMRQIADELDIRAASIYNHFPSKEGILSTIYQYFDENMSANAPDLDKALALAETAHPHEALRELNMVFPEDILTLMSKTMFVTHSMVRYDRIAADIIERNLIDMTEKFDRPILEKMLALGRIEPLDIDSFILIHTNYCYSSANRFYLNEKAIATERWLQGMEMIFTIVRPKI